MFRKFSLAALAAATMAVAVPTAADAQPRGRAHGYWNNSAHAQAYRGDRYRRGDVYRSGRYATRSNSRYYNESRYNRRCSGTTGTIVGGAAGALLGREITRNRRHSGTTGTILGAAIGALAGRAIDKKDC
jgi:outer membrane lipoprotein SlyB